LIAPILLASALGIGVVFALGHRLYGRAGAVIAALLVAVTPLDFAWSTMLAGDILLSALEAAAVLCWLRALDAEEPAARARNWVGAAVSLWLAFHAKVSAVLVAPALAIVALVRWRRLDRTFLAFFVTAALLFGGTALVSHRLTGDFLAPLSAELRYQGLRQPDAPQLHRLTPEVWWSYPRWLFLRDHLGDLVFSVHGWAAFALALLAWRLRLRAPGLAWLWLLAVFLGMQCNVTRYQGAWVVGFRNLRHAHVFVYPLALVVAGYLARLYDRMPRAAAVVALGLVVYGGWASVTTASRTRPIFRQLRELTAELAVRPRRPVLSDFQVGARLTYANLSETGWVVREMHQIDGEQRRIAFAAARDAYAVTGGGREPYYGCIDCIPRAADLAQEEWRLIREWPIPADPPRWWPEPMRLWERQDATPR
jgi:4-amino-4-deoxy-L-arabinose transferase-like glycosyltransferase